MRIWLRVLLFVSLLATARSARAHDPFEITTTGRVRAATIELEVTMTRNAALRLATARGAAPNDVAALSVHLYAVSLAGKTLGVQGSSARASEENELVFHVTYEKPSPGALRLDATHVVALGEGYTSALQLSQEAPARSLGFHVLTAATPTLELELRPPPAGSERAGAPSPEFGAFFRLGLEHILEGYDHLLFLGGLLIAARRLRSTLLLVSAFTVSHSLTLALSVLGWVELPSVVVESTIALSIVFVGAENLWLKEEPRHRAALVFAFGLVHGLGFAGALREATEGAPPGELLMPLAGFNLGVEAGQIGLGLLALPLLLHAKKQRFGPSVLAATSIVIALTGAYLFAERGVLS